MILNHPGKKLMVLLDKKFRDVLMTPGGIMLYQDTDFRPGWHTTVNGIIYSLPRNLSSKYDLKRGDDIAFSYLVVIDRIYHDNREDVFYEDAQGPVSNIVTWSNKAGMTIMMRYLQNDKWEMIVFDTEKKVYQHEKGGESIIDYVKGQYTFAETNDIRYTNNFTYKQKDFWFVDEEFLYAVRRDGKIKMLGDHVLLEPPVEVKEGKTNAGLILLNDRRQLGDRELQAKVLHVEENNEGLHVGDMVVVDTKKVQRYSFWGKDYLLARYDQILATV